MEKSKLSRDPFSGTTQYLTDTIESKSGTPIKFLFFKHSSFAIEVGGRVIYSDPVSDFAPYEQLPIADLILVSHSHYDHLNTEAINKICDERTTIICDKSSEQSIPHPSIALSPSDAYDSLEWVKVEAVAAYNTSPQAQDFHPKDRGDCGYVLTLEGLRIYIAGDGEVTTEMKSLQDIDIAFLPINQPYTMTESQAIEAIEALRPKIFYPYHYGQVEHQTDIDFIVSQLSAITQVRIRGME